MKKFISVLAIVFVLVSVFSVSALAADSPSGKPVVSTPVDAVTTVGGQEQGLVVEKMDAEVMAELNTAQKDVMEQLMEDVQSEKSEEVQKELVETYADVKVDAIAYSNVVDIRLTGDMEMPKEGLTITIKDKNILAGDTVVMLHLTKEGVWENIKTTVTAGAVTGHFTSLSPVYYFKLGTKGNTSEEAPETGDVAPFVALFAVVATAGVVVSKKRLAA